MHAKINSFLNEPFEKDETAKIEFDEEETPLNLNQFYQVFRADTNKVRKPKIVQDLPAKKPLAKEADK